MRNTLFLLIALLTCMSAAIAQPQVSLSEPFDEPAALNWKKVMQLKNGNTFYFYNNKKGIEVTVYGKDHKVKSQNTVNGKDWQARMIPGSTITSVQEINGEPVIFLTTEEDKIHKLYRVVFDPEAGTIKDEKNIGTILKYEMGDEAQLNGYYVSKDPISENYAVVAYNNKMPDATKRMKVDLYSPTHEELASSLYGKPENFRFLNLIAMCVVDKDVIMACSGSNVDAVDDKNAKLIISRLSKGETAVTHQVATTTENFKSALGVMRYHPGKKKILMLTHAMVAEQKKTGSGLSKIRTLNNIYKTLLSEIDPATLSIKSNNVAYKKQTDIQKSPYLGFAQDFIINKDNSLTIVSENFIHQQVNTSYAPATGGYKSYRTATTKMENAGITNLTENGEETKAATITKASMYRTYLGPFNHWAKNNGFWEALAVNFYSVDYINTGTAQYVMFNDLPENLNELKNDLGGISAASLMCYEISDKPTKYFLFGAPDGKHNRAFSDLRASHFQESTNTYAALIVETEKKKQGRIAWMTFK